VSTSSEFQASSSFPTPPEALDPPTRRQLLWIAGAIGITPPSYRYCLQFRSLIREELQFLSKLISSSSTRELDVTLSLISSALGVGKAPAASYLKLHIFSNAVEVPTSPGIEYTLHPGRIPATFFEERKELLPEKDKGIYFLRFWAF